MKKLLSLLLMIIVLPFLVSQKPPRNDDKPYVEGEIMIKLFSNQPQSQQQMLQKVLADYDQFELSMVQKLSDRLDIFLLKFNPSLVDENRLLDEIKTHPFVELAQFNHFIQQRSVFPNDNFFDLQWALHNTGQSGGVNDADIDGPEAWDLGTSGVTATGDTIIVAIVDDGFDIDHEDLVFWKNYHDIPGNGIDDDTNGYIDDYDGWNAWNNNGNITEKDHGTHVAGIAAAKGNNGMGVSGVNWNVKLMPVVVTSSIVESVVVAGYAYVHEMRATYNETDGSKGAFVVSTNASFGIDKAWPEDYPIWGTMYDSLGMIGVLSSGATANADWNVDEVGDIPTSFPSEFLITVTNTDKNDTKNTGAAYGPTTIDLGAPGTQIYSTRSGNFYGNKSGCSMAAPQVAGAIAYMFSVADESFMNACHNDPAGMALVIKQYILDGTDPIPTLDGITVSGGRLNIYNSASLMLDPEITFNPMSLLQILEPGEQDSLILAFTNNSSQSVDYSFAYPESQTWFSMSGPLNGTLNAFGTEEVMAHFTAINITTDTLFMYLTFNYGDDGQILVPVHLFVQIPVGVGSENEGLEAWEHGILKVWPNPVKEMLNVECFMLNEGENYTLCIINSAGNQIKEIKIPGGQNKVEINTESYEPGVYIAILKAKGQIIGNNRFVVMN
jgi:subtilisin family serine protease